MTAMLSRSGFNIRKLISSRRSREYDGESTDQDEPSNSKSAVRQRDRSWPGSKKSPRKPPKPAVVVRKTQIVHRVSSPLPPLPDTPYSSVSSLCSCEYHMHASSGCPPDKRSPGLCSVQSKNSSERSQPPSIHHGQDGQASSPRYIPRGPRELVPTPDPIKSTLDLLEALSLDPYAEDETASALLPTPPAHTPVEVPSAGWSDDVSQLIQATDEAFRAVGTALAQAERNSEEFAKYERPRTPPAPAARRKPPPPPVVSPKRRTSTVPAPPLKSPKRIASVPKPKRRNSKKQKQRSTVRPPVLAPGPRRTLTENVSELFSMKLFHRIEADEMLTPEQMHHMRQSRIAQLRQRKSTETVRTVESDTTDTPVEPFHLEDLPSRIGSSGVRLTVPSPVVETRPSSSASSAGTQGDSSISTKEANPAEVKKSTTNAQGKEAMTYQEVSSPPPPSKNPLRFLPRRQLPPLPTIPEVMVTPAPGDEIARPGSPNSGHVFLRSTLYTLTMPTFRQGPIRLTKADLAPEPRPALDDVVDWTAFQMAILGGAGDFLSPNPGFYWDHEDDHSSDGEADADDLSEWFDSLGFEHAGRIIHEPVAPAPKKRSRRSGSTPSLSHTVASVTAADLSPVSSVSSCDDDPTPTTELAAAQRLPIPARLGLPGGSLPPQGRRSGGSGSRRWTTESPSKRHRPHHFASLSGSGSGSGNAGGARPFYDHRASTGSLPQSPMLRIVVGEDGAVETGGDVVPMGYNLGHDLGDFLKWEAQHAYAASSYHSD